MLIKIQKYRGVLKEYQTSTLLQDDYCNIFVYILPDFTLTVLRVCFSFENFCDHISKCT